MKTEQTMQPGPRERQADDRRGHGDPERTTRQTRRSRTFHTILTLLLAGALLVEGLTIWNDRSSVVGDVTVPQASEANEASGERWVPPQAQAYLPCQRRGR